jgi:DNA-binding FadR family transcriptional regulator
LTEFMRANRESRAFQEAAWQYRQTINDQYAGPRLSAEIRASQSFIPRVFWVTYMNNHDEMLPFYEAETEAIRGGDPDAARAACAGRSEAMGRIMLSELVRRGVFSPSAVTREPSVAF